MKKKLDKKVLFLASGFLVPLAILISPSWLEISGIGPSWAVIWLLPFSLASGSTKSLVGALSLGLILDAISLGGPSHIPALLILGFWWGRIGETRPQIESSFNIGLLAWIGSMFLGLTLWIQNALFVFDGQPYLLNQWAFTVLLCQGLVTAFLAPLIGLRLLRTLAKKN